jgi:hypothetical protein
MSKIHLIFTSCGYMNDPQFLFLCHVSPHWWKCFWIPTFTCGYMPTWFVYDFQSPICLIMTWSLHDSAEGHWKDSSMTGQPSMGWLCLVSGPSWNEDLKVATCRGSTRCFYAYCGVVPHVVIIPLVRSHYIRGGHLFLLSQMEPYQGDSMP